jgi:glycosyltransferase involved in cell wall biosynthesis
MKTVNVTLDYAAVTGGSAESVRQFENVPGAAAISFTSAELLPQAIRAPNVVHIPVQGAGFARVYARPDASGLLGAEDLLRNADLIFCHKLFRFHNDWVRRTAWRLDIPYCVIPHGSLDPYVFTYRRLRKALWMKSLGRRFFAESAGFLFATEREKEKALARVPGHRAWVIHWPVPQPPSGAGCERERMRDRLGVAADEKVLLFLGRLHSMKRPLETIAALAKAAVSGVRLLMVGPADEYSQAEVEEFAMRNGAANVQVFGPAYGREKWELYRAADAFINLSARENFGFTVVEALATGLPVLLSPGNDLAGDLREERCGWFLEGDEDEAAVEAIRGFAAATPEALRAMGARGQAWAACHTGMERFTSSLLGLCREVTGHD